MSFFKSFKKKHRVSKTPAPAPKKRKKKPTVIRRNSPTVLLDILHREDSKPDSRKNSLEGYTHVSSLLHACPRRSALITMDKIVDVRRVRGADRVLWALGRSAEEHVRRQIITHMGYDHVIGKWHCACGALEYTGFFDHNRHCDTCGVVADEYGEVDLIDDRLKITGHPDLPLVLEKSIGGPNLIYIVECKTLNKREFDLQTGPKEDHVSQAAAYRKMFKEDDSLNMGMGVAKEVIIIYVCKDYSFKGSVYHEYHVDVTKGIPAVNTKLMWDDQATALRDAGKGKLPPRLDACPSMDSPTAKECVACVNCFSRGK